MLNELLRKARAVKIKLILIAQNISSENAMQNVRTNLTFKIGLKLATASFSKSAIGEVGCEKLQGKGDLYFSEDGKLRYAVSPLIEDEDLRKLL